MTPEEREELLATMYQVSEDEPDEQAELITEPNALNVDVDVAGKYVTIEIDKKHIRVPSCTYIEALERKNAEYEREFLRMKSSIKQLRAAIMKHDGEFNDVYRQLDRKFDKRD